MTAPATVSRCPRCNCNRWYRELHDERTCAACGHVDYGFEPLDIPNGAKQDRPHNFCADCGAEVSHLESLRCQPCARRSLRAEMDRSRPCRAHAIREKGHTWAQVALLVGYHDGSTAQRAVRVHRRICETCRGIADTAVQPAPLDGLGNQSDEEVMRVTR